jgi:hypothetical protein
MGLRGVLYALRVWGGVLRMDGVASVDVGDVQRPDLDGIYVDSVLGVASHIGRRSCSASVVIH